MNLFNESIPMASYTNIILAAIALVPSVQDAIAQSVDRRLPLWEVGSSNPSWVKPVTYKIVIWCCLAWRSALLTRRERGLVCSVLE